jgi:5-methylcytosine-specific restriction protein A
LVEKPGRCPEHARQAERARGTFAQRGYRKGHKKFRRLVLERDPVCVICRSALSVIADHYPLGRDELVEQGLNPDDPRYGRGLCRSCDSKQTAARQPGGFNAA